MLLIAWSKKENIAVTCKNHFNKELVMTKEDNEDFKNSTKYHWKSLEVTGKYRGSAHRDFNINVKLNHKIFVMFHDLKQYDFHLIMQELGKFSLKFLNLKILNSTSKFFIR